jgi:hypothetical protein
MIIFYWQHVRRFNNVNEEIYARMVLNEYDSYSMQQ